MTLGTLGEALERAEAERKRLEVHASDGDVATELQRQFTSRNVAVEYRRAAGFDDGFVVIRDSDGEFRGALGLEEFDALLSPEIHPPWALEETDVDLRKLLDFLEGTPFAAADRRQLLAVSREIEERAWRVADGTLYAGFQREAAFADQLEAYERLAARGTLSVTAFLDDAWDAPLEGPSVVSASGEIGRFWFVAFEAADTDRQSCALVAEERQPGEYDGVWTYDPAFVAELVDHLEASYEIQEA